MAISTFVGFLPGLPGRPAFAASLLPAGVIGWLGFAALGAIVAAVVVHAVHERRATRRTVAEALQGRVPRTDEEFGCHFYPPEGRSVAARARRLLADHLNCDLSGLIPADDFEKWLGLFPGPDSAADSFFEELANEFRLSRDCPWPERFGSFDALVRFVVERGSAARAQ